MPCTVWGVTERATAAASSLLPEQFRHYLLVRDCSWPTRGHPVPVGRQSGLDLGLFDYLSRGKPLDRLQPTHIWQGHNRRVLAT
jgi:hypothetical protein